MKQVFIMRGLPGSGKSRWVTENMDKDSIRVSADDYFNGADGVYRFDPSMIGEAHSRCMRAFAVEVVCAGRGKHIFVDNTNISAFEVGAYHSLAVAYDYRVMVVRVHCHPDVCIRRNIHGVPPDLITKMAQSFEPLPAWVQVQHIYE